MAEPQVQTSEEIFDFIVVGSGAGGGPLAANLALAGFSVLILEAGDDHSCLYYSIPIMQAYASEDPAMRWDFFVRHYDDAADAHADPKYVADRGGVWYPRGSTLGGSTAISAMVTIYPHPSDWTRLAELTGDDSWNAESMRRLITRLEAWRGVDAAPLPGDDEAARDRKAAHGLDGWLGTTRADPKVGGRDERFLDVIGAMERTARDRFGIDEEISLPRDPNAADTPVGFEGMTFIPVAVAGGHRVGSRERIRSVRDAIPDRLSVRTDTLVTRVVFDGDRAVGVECVSGSRLYAASPQDAGPASSPTMIRARREVILSAGTFNTPQLLKLSGIGPADELAALGIDVVVDAPGVGRNLHDRYEVAVVTELDADYPIFGGAALDIPADPADGDALYTEWRDAHDGPYTTNGTLAAIVAKSAAAHDDSDLIVFSLPIDFRGYYPGYAEDAVAHRNRLSILILKAHTDNRAGTVTLRSADPRDVPEIAFRYFEEGDAFAADLEGVVDGVEIARDIVGHLRLATPVAELIPGRRVSDRAGLRDYVRSHAWGHHACGTAKIGRDDDPLAVLDGDFRVRGVTGLRVVDASVFPDIPGFFIASAVYLISEKASDVIAAEYARSEGRHR